MDSSYNYSHINHPNHILYASKWSLQPIPYDDIDTERLLDSMAALFPDDEDDITMPQLKAATRRKGQKKNQPVWTDLSLDRFLASTPQTARDAYRDHTMVPPMFTGEDESDGVNEYLSNGFNHPATTLFTAQSTFSHMQSPPPLGYEPPSFATPATPRIRASSNMSETPRIRQSSVHTPRVPSGTPRNQTPFQTPNTRIMR
ncbi:hypothetical protein DICA3_A10968 [Diutina catenulata]